MSLINHLSAPDYNLLHHTPITDLAEAKAYIKVLVNNSLVYHFEEDPEDILWGLSADRLPTEADKQALNTRTRECYQKSIDWSQDGDCPIGYCLICLEEQGLVP